MLTQPLTNWKCKKTPKNMSNRISRRTIVKQGDPALTAWVLPFPLTSSAKFKV